MQATILIEGKVPGQRQPLFADWRMPFPPEWESGGGRLTLRELIARIVQEEVRAFQERQEERKVARILSERDIERGLMKGKVDMGGREAAQSVDPEAAVATALLAFEDGLYYVFVDEAQQERLEQEIYLKPDSRVTFIRLVALAGG